jgi:CBS domain-containing protein
MNLLVDTVASLIREKDPSLWSISPEAQVYEAIQIMADKHVGSLLVISQERLVGIITERDYARKVILRGKSSRLTEISEIMTSSVIFVSPDHTVEDCMRIMSKMRIRYLPVLRNEEILGILSIGDLIKWVISAQEETIVQLQHYIAGAYPG